MIEVYRLKQLLPGGVEVDVTIRARELDAGSLAAQFAQAREGQWGQLAELLRVMRPPEHGNCDGCGDG